jgi:hypothetical protein
MIASENDAGAVKTDARRNGLYETAEIGRRHTGVAALLVDLIAGRLDKDAPARTKSQQQCGFDDDWMGGANRCDARPAVGQPFAHKKRERPGHG